MARVDSGAPHRHLSGADTLPARVPSAPSRWDFVLPPQRFRGRLKPFLTYALMVGLPTLGVLGVLHAGSGLRAPYAVGGEWKVTAGPLVDSAFVMQQSGEHVSLVLHGSRLAGRLRRDTLELSSDGTLASHASVCGPERGTTLRALVDASVHPRRMRGALTSRGSGCPAVQVEAELVPRAHRAAGGR